MPAERDDDAWIGLLLSGHADQHGLDLDRLQRTRGYKEPGLGNPEVQKSYYYVATGAIAANVYLFAAAEGLAAWFHNCDKQNTPREFKLRPSQRVLFAQTVGYPAKP